MDEMYLCSSDCLEHMSHWSTRFLPHRESQYWLSLWTPRVGTLASPFGEASLASGFWWNRVQDTTLTILPFSCYYSNHYSGY